MDVRLFQNCVQDKHFGLVQKGFEPLDFRHNPHPELREFQIFEALYRDGVYKSADVLGAVSTRFQGKSLLDGKQVADWITSSPGYDVYVVNPYPQFAYTHKNLWQFSENTRDPKFTEKSQAVLNAAGLDYDLSSVGHHHTDILSCCSYWFGTPRFWERYMEEMILPVLRLSAQDLGVELHDFLYKNQEYYGVAAKGCGSLPFLLERSVSIYLQKQQDIRALFYPSPRERVYECCLFPFERDLVATFGDRVDYWHSNNIENDETEDYFRFSSKMCGSGWRLYFKFHPMNFEHKDQRLSMPWAHESNNDHENLNRDAP
ncbi:hypothetical protein HGO37_21715 [Rhizobium sp. CG4]|uniref:hypothetical protein n=1 Tax=Rhizobium sp. CG4 TaxID=2726075 RepID=UPI002034424A|nr:hypothetical protein [Rhizobium sp. CG4]MCM2458013.1 hypothetical protein [Rhizobium sp. CG4]